MNKVEINQKNLDRQLLDISNWSKIGLDPAKGLLLMGKPGVGKTHFINKFIEHHKKHMYQTTAYDIETSFQKSGSEIISRWHWSDLFIDDLGIESVHLNVFGTVYYPLKQVLFERHRLFLGLKSSHTNQITHITTNLNLEEIRRRYDERIIDRLFEMCNFVHVTGTSYRAQ